jgi:competence protein ComEC
MYRNLTQPLRLRAVALLLAVLLLLLAGCADIPALASAGENALLQIVMLDVGQGDSILIQSKGEAMLVDAGENDRGDDVLSALRSHGVTHLRAVVGTHPHSDHIGGLDTVIDGPSVDAVYLPEKASYTDTYEDLLDAIDRKGLTVTVPEPDESLRMGDAEIHFLWPPNELDDEDANDHSIVILVKGGGKSILLTGDIGKGVEAELLKTYAELHCDVLKVAHHGSSSSSSADFLDTVRPDAALISVGKGNEYKHPAAATLRRLEDRGITVYRTDRNGEITVNVSEGKLSIVTERH